MNLQISYLFGLIFVGYATANLSFDSLPEYNVSRSSYHVPVSNYTEFEYWSLNVSKFSIDGADGSNITIAMIGDGVNYNLVGDNCVGSDCSIQSVIDIYTNSSVKFTETQITEDTLAAKVLLANAPETKIKSYKIFESFNSTTSFTSKLAAAVLNASNDESVDFIFITTWQMYGGWEASELSQFLNQIALVKPVVMPMGHSPGLFQMSDGAAAKDVISVGSSGSEGVLGFPLEINDGETVGYYADVELDLYANNTLVLGELTNNCSFIDKIAKDDSNILFFDVGNCSPDQVVSAVSQTNYSQIIAIGDTYENFEFNTTEVAYTSAMLGKKYGADIMKRLKDGETIVAHSTSSTSYITIDYSFNAFTQNFNSSCGPTLDLYLKPNILAQGNYYFDDLKVYASGNALSAAYVASAIAAYGSHSQKNSWKSHLPDRITSSGNIIGFNNLIETSIDIAGNPSIQGGGILNPQILISKTFDVFPGFISLNDTANATEYTIEITNNGFKHSRFFISGVASITLYAQSIEPEYYDYNMYPFPNIGNDTGAVVTSEKNSVLIPANSSVNITVKIIPPAEYYANEATRLPVYGGYVEIIEESTGLISNIPYLGVAVKMNSLETQSLENFYWKQFYSYKAGWNTCTMWEDGEIVNDTHHWLQMYWDQRIGSPLVDILVVQKDWSETDFVYPPVIGKHKFVGRIKGERLGDYPWPYSPRTNNTEDSQWDNWKSGLLADGTRIPNGEYKIILRIMKHNVDDPSDWNEWWNHISPWFKFDYPTDSISSGSYSGSMTAAPTNFLSTLLTTRTTSSSSMAMDMSNMDMGGMQM